MFVTEKSSFVQNTKRIMDLFINFYKYLITNNEEEYEEEESSGEEESTDEESEEEDDEHLS